MISAIYIALTFIGLLGLFARLTPSSNSGIIVIGSLIGAMALQSAFYFCILALPVNSMHTMQFLLVLWIFAFGGAALINHKGRKAALAKIQEALFWPTHENYRSHDLNIIRNSVIIRDTASAYKKLILFTIFSLTGACLFNAFPGNYDSNTYNIARVVSMIGTATPFLDSTGVVRQAVLPLSHDILYFPDILFGNLRGLGLISLIEFIAILCCLVQITINIITCSPRLNQQLRPSILYLSLIFCVFFAAISDIQVMQSVITKNDLVITLLFTACVNFMIVARNHPESYREIFSVSFLALSYAVSCKNYGLICIVPILIMVKHFILRSRQRFFGHFAVQTIDRVPRPSRFKNIRSGFASFFFVTAALLQIAISVLVDRFGDLHYAEKSLLVSVWTNTGSSWSEILQNSLINLIRNVVNIFLYPLRIIPGLKQAVEKNLEATPLHNYLTSTFGTGGTSSFEWASYGQDTSHSVILLAFVVIGLLSIYQSLKRLNRDLDQRMFTVRSLNMLCIFEIFIACISSFALISSAVLYQPWIGRFLGPAYVPLIAPFSLISAGLFLNIHAKHRARYLAHKILLKVVLLLGMLFFLSHVFMATLNSDLRYAFGKSMSKTDLVDRRYVHHVTSKAQDNAAYHRFIDELSDGNFKKRIFCSGEDSWTLTPMIKSIHNRGFNGRNVASMSTQDCTTLIRENTSLPSFSMASRSFPYYLRVKGVDFIFIK